MSAFATYALITRIGAGNVGLLLHDLDRGHTVENLAAPLRAESHRIRSAAGTRIGVARR
jgi:hypothetical protein